MMFASQTVTGSARRPSAYVSHYFVNKVMVDTYPEYILLHSHKVEEADNVIESCIELHPDDRGYLVEAAQYYARKCEYHKAIDLYERS